MYQQTQNKMNRAEALQTLITIDSMISYYESIINDRKHNNEFGAGFEFQSIRKMNDHDIEISSMCIERLNQRFRKITLTLK